MEAAPESITVSKGGAKLVISVRDGVSHAIDAPALRLACRCAHCARARIDGKFPERFDGVTIAEVMSMGHYGLNITFSDGTTGVATFTDLAGGNTAHFLDGADHQSGNFTIASATMTFPAGTDITGFGNFEARKRSARVGRNPKTGATIQIKASIAPAFRAGKQLKMAVNNKK